MRPYYLILFFLFSALAACHSSTHDVKQVAFDALENARIQLDSGNKAEAMKLFKEAEYYGLMADDTEEADYLGTTVNMVDKMRGRVRKKMVKS